MKPSFGWLGVDSTFRQSLRSVDLRFTSAENELLFRRELSKKSFRLSSVAGLIHVALQFAVTATRLSQALSGQEIAALDLVFLLFQALAALFMACASLGSLQGSGTCFGSFSEPVWACAIGLNVVAGLFQGRRWRSWMEWRVHDCVSDEISEISSVLLSLAFVAIACHTLPVRCCFLGPLVLLASVTCIVQAAVGTGCDAAPGSSLLNAALLLFLLGTAYYAGQRFERALRVVWLRDNTQERLMREDFAEKEIIKARLSRDLKVFKLYGCCLALGLHEDFRIVCGSLDAATSFFGTEVRGLDFLSLLDESDREGFSLLCKRMEGSRIPRSVTMTLVLHQSRAACQLILLYHGQPGRTYLLGIRSPSGREKSGRGGPEMKQISSQPGTAAEDVHQDVDHPFAVHPVVPVVPVPNPVGNPKPPENDELRKLDSPPDARAAKADFSGFSSDPDAPSSASLCYTASTDGDASGWSLIGGRTEADAQTDPMTGKKEMMVQTSVTWAQEEAFRCRCCELPPCPLDDEQRDAIACSNFKPRRRKRRASNIDALQGTWALDHSFISIAQTFMHRLTFVGDRCIDAIGQRWKVTDDGGTFYLIKGRIWVTGGVLFREGKSGIVMRFRREETPDEDPLDQEDPFQEESLQDDDAQDSLQVLENIVSQNYDDSRPAVQDMLMELYK